MRSCPLIAQCGQSFLKLVLPELGGGTDVCSILSKAASETLANWRYVATTASPCCETDESHPPGYWKDEDVLIDLGEEVQLDLEYLESKHGIIAKEAVMPTPYSHALNQCPERRSSDIPSSLIGVPLLSKLYRENCLHYDCTNSNLMPILSNSMVLKHAFHEKRVKVRRMARFRDAHFREIKFVNQTWLSLVGGQLDSLEYEFRPEQEVEVLLSSGRTRLMAIPTPKDEIVLEALRLVLEAIYEPLFLDYSHGFRPGKGRQSALREIKRYFWGMDYFVVCNHEEALQEYKGHEMVNHACHRISDPKFRKLLYKALEVGYVNLFGLNSDELVAKQKERGISPILLNIFLHQLDIELERIKSEYCRGHNQLVFPDLDKPSRPLNRKMRFVRYAGSVFIGVRGVYEEAKGIKDLVVDFLSSHFSMNEGVHAAVHRTEQVPRRSRMAQFLGFTVCTEKLKRQKGTSNMHAPLTSQMCPKLLIPTWRVMNMFKRIGFVRKVNSATSMTTLTNWAPEDIVEYFDHHVQALMEYYAMADNYRDLQFYVHLLKRSCALTLARKHKLRTERKVYLKYGRDLTVEKEGRVVASLPDRSMSIRPLIQDFHPSLTSRPGRQRHSRDATEPPRIVDWDERGHT